jgi:hypothetical protein
MCEQKDTLTNSEQAPSMCVTCLTDQDNPDTDRISRTRLVSQQQTLVDIPAVTWQVFLAPRHWSSARRWLHAANAFVEMGEHQACGV